MQLCYPIGGCRGIQAIILRCVILSEEELLLRYDSGPQTLSIGCTRLRNHRYLLFSNRHATLGLMRNLIQSTGIIVYSCHARHRNQRRLTILVNTAGRSVDILTIFLGAVIFVEVLFTGSLAIVRMRLLSRNNPLLDSRTLGPFLSTGILLLLGSRVLFGIADHQKRVVAIGSGGFHRLNLDSTLSRRWSERAMSSFLRAWFLLICTLLLLQDSSSHLTQI